MTQEEFEELFEKLKTFKEGLPEGVHANINHSRQRTYGVIGHCLCLDMEFAIDPPLEVQLKEAKESLKDSQKEYEKQIKREQERVAELEAKIAKKKAKKCPQEPATRR